MLSAGLCRAATQCAVQEDQQHGIVAASIEHRAAVRALDGAGGSPFRGLSRAAARSGSWLALASGLVAGAGAQAQEAQPPPASSAFVQYSHARDHTDALTVGWAREWAWRRPLGAGHVVGYWEVAFGRWSTGHEDNRGHAWVTQVGVTPVLRWYVREAGDAFVEGGIGAHVVAPLYRKPNKRFSTTLNFGDHVAVGYRFGEDRRHEIALRFQHFSNAGIRQPNPGENFVQLRYARRF
jgi:hypothetical protein